MENNSILNLAEEPQKYNKNNYRSTLRRQLKIKKMQQKNNK